MAKLRTGDGSLVPLRVWQIIGRAPGCGLRCDAPDVSLEHASLSWNGHAWVVRDLASTNGTSIGAEVIPASDSRPLEPGDILTIGASATFTLVSGGPPVAFAEHEAHGIVEGSGDLLSLPDEQTMVYMRDDGTWVWERGAEQRAISDGARLEGWAFHLPDELAPTAELSGPPTIEELVVHFRVRRDEERVEISVRTPDGQEHELGARAHNYTLLTLARHRESDESGPGWVPTEALAHMLRVDPNLIYTHVFRARRQFATLEVIGAADIVERRGEELRLGPTQVEITRF